MAVQEENTAVGDQMQNKKKPEDGVRAMFAEQLKLLGYYKAKAVPVCKVRFAIWPSGGKKWELSKDVKFPVALYDNHGKLRVAHSLADISEILGRSTKFQQVALTQVSLSAHFVWVEFERQRKPRMVNPEHVGVKEIDWHTVDRIARFTDPFFYYEDVTRIRLHFAVDSDGNFSLMEGLICG